ncbi:protein CCA1 isoform X3 [Elaeis guineensis]|uniref:Protein LHY isoform X3 n=1 Tax=Elaeis guineensis var. tenera TaxID=51953 RepID=A0A6J0PPW1_ELAGV|nr:protein LHY isoform X3 [Elaeis guineensis]
MEEDSFGEELVVKLEKEAVMKGIPPGQTHDIDIPPPRPKRKPSSPYPRKTSVVSISLTGDAIDNKSSKSVSLVGTSKQILEQGSDAPQKKPAATITSQRKEISVDGSCSEVLNFFQDAPSASIFSVKSSSNPNPCTYTEFVPKMKEIKETATDKSSVSIEVNKDLNINGISYRDQENEGLKGLHIDSQTNLGHGEDADASKQQENLGSLLSDDMQANQSNSKHIPVHFSQRSSAEGNQTIDSDGHNFMAVTGQVGADENSKSFIDPMIYAAPKLHNSCAIPCVHQPFPAFPPFTQFHSDHDAYRSFLNISSTFSSLIVYTLLQNPAVHAAANLAASFWPSANMNSSTDSTPEILAGGSPVRHMNPYPSLASIAAATVAAASAWWATQGLLPICSPHIGFTFNPAPATTIPTMATAQGPEDKTDGKEDGFQNLVPGDPVVNPDQSLALNTQGPSPKSSSSEADESDESRSGERSHCTDVKASRINMLKPLAATGLHDSDKTKSKKKPDRSSCGSNTPSSSEVETDAILDRHEKVNDEAKQAYFSNPSAGETNGRRSRNGGSINESWKAVSEEGRLAFQALFSREVLPQSFSPPQTEEAMANKEAITLPVDLNRKAYATACFNHLQSFTKEMSSRCTDNIGKSPLTSEIGQGKLKSHRTGFKPYKRCSMEAKESRTAGEETGNKRIRLEGEAST